VEYLVLLDYSALQDYLVPLDFLEDWKLNNQQKTTPEKRKK